MAAQLPHSPVSDSPRGAVLVVGEALVDIVTEQTTERFADRTLDRIDRIDRHVSNRPGWRTTPGGSPLNIAVGLARLGVPVTLATQFGHDEHGQLIAAHLTAAGVILDQVAGRTSTAHATLSQGGSADYQFDVQWARSVPAWTAAPTVAHTGSLAAFLPSGADAAVDLFDQLPATTVRSLDPNIRPALLQREQAQAQFDRLARRAHIIKLSDEDADWLMPGASVEQVLTRLIAGGASIAALTQGAAGSTLASASATVTVPAPTVRVIDTIGAGDAYMSGLLFAALEDSALSLIRERVVGDDLLRHLGITAAASAAVAVSHAGAHPPTAQELRTSI